ncbi:MAG TPA: alpha-glucan family phosphorylase [Actinomycetota bacterium]|nr:alpha-glucan family phosphorylase [Actinomycetota bacterium]
MKALRSFAVRASLPEPLGVLLSIATNLRWSWDPKVVDLFRWVDAEAWDRAGHDPVRMLGLVSKERFAELADDAAFMSFLTNVHDDLVSYLEEARWFQSSEKTHDLPRQVAYFSPEFGVSEALPIYSGGLGVLAGDHLKAASDLGVPLVAVGLLYRQGYFRQHLNADGWQQERYPALDPHGMPLTLLSGDDGSPLKIEVDLAGARCVAQLWRATVGRIPLILMDSDVEENDPEERRVTDRLYAGGGEHRLRQEIVLGIGGIRALQAAGYDCDVFHSNEGHAGFLGFERIRQLVTSTDLSFSEALEAVRAATVFTTHTPVPAGIDVYDIDLMERYFDRFAKECNIAFADLMALGRTERETPPSDDARFNMAVMGLRLAARSNAVSRLHGEVSRAIFSELWPRVPTEEVPIGSVTNGVHAATWLGPELREVLGRRLSPGWVERGEGRWRKISEVPDAELWRARERARERLVYFVRERVREQLIARGHNETEVTWTDEIFDPGVLTIGFARRFAQYKRGTLLLTDVDRLKRLLLSGDRPIQIVIAGKAHPLDDGGKEMIQALVHFAADPEIRLRFAFVEDYDMEVGRVLCQGSDVWLNNPRRPLEACGTSGMKAALNGALNCSVLDGWWDECYDGNNGWAIGTRETFLDQQHQDRVEASALYDILEREVVPRFYDRPEGPIPRRWVERMKHSISSLGSCVTADRMVRDYVEDLYAPAAIQGRELAADSFSRARGLAAWKAKVASAWEEVRVIDVEGDVTAADVGATREVAATIRVGTTLSTDDIAVQLAHGRVGANNELIDPELVEMTPDHCTEGTCTYRGSFATEEAGLYGYAVRVVPRHPDVTNGMDLGVVTWA